MSQVYDVSEIFGGVVQGEGLHAGYPCCFLRFQFCNLWKKADKPSTLCPFCDTKQLHEGSSYTFDQLMQALVALHTKYPLHGLVISGGEPMLQLDARLLEEVSSLFQWVDIETNGTQRLMLSKPDNVFISCSPKTEILKIDRVDWYKVLIPDKEHLLPMVLQRAALDFAAVYVQPVEAGGYDSDITKENIRRCIDLCNKHGTIRLSLQLHKIVGIR